MSALDDAIAELESAAARLRSGDIESDEAAALVERCAELAARVGAELDRRSSADPDDLPAGQERLL
ncbi:MAG: exodeoxyribonuclease VII small subunit [Actinobacteria bacterium]|nr:MAG: exodeoxyribonuclease VII small subunit [Actinomycetota bacterium]